VSRALALGIRVRTARATAVVLKAGDDLPELILRTELATSDPAVPESRQPFHAGLDLPDDRASAVVARAVGAVMRASAVALEKLVDGVAPDAKRIAGIGLAITSNTDPASIANPHMRAHASEGRLFHDALVTAADELAIAHHTLLEKQLSAYVARASGRSADAIKRALSEWGKQAGAPWRALEKSACLAAWAVLSLAER
jgi:hypothetical protein